MNESISSRILALDLGDKRIGIALSDRTLTFATGQGVIKRSSRKSDFEKIGRLLIEQNIGLVIVGLPTLPSGEEGTRAAWARDYATALGHFLRCKVELWDESLSTVDAEASLRAQGYGSKQRRERVDSVAAAFILQSYLDARRVEEPDLTDAEEK